MIKQITRVFSNKIRRKRVTEESHNYHEIQLSRSPEELLIENEKKEIEKYPEFLQEFGDNFEQKRAVVSDSKRILVLAGAGSGKTKVLSKRFVYQIGRAH